MSRPGLIWGYDVRADALAPVSAEALMPDEAATSGAPGLAPADGADLRWLHLNLADQSTCRWIAGLEAALPASVLELLLSTDAHQRALIDGGCVACVLHDFERRFGEDEPLPRVAALRIVLGPGIVLTARHHPLASGDVVKRRIDQGLRPLGPGAALDAVVSAVAGIAAERTLLLNRTVQAAEDALLGEGETPDPKSLAAMRRLSVLVNRQLGGLRAVLHRLEEDEDLPEALLPTIEKLAQRIAAIVGDVQAVQADLRLLREELDLQAAQRTNQNLYVLSILSALLLPATLVTGFFGMNTGGFPWHDSAFGTFFAGIVAFASAFLVYVWLRWRGFLGGK